MEKAAETILDVWTTLWYTIAGFHSLFSGAEATKRSLSEIDSSALVVNFSETCAGITGSHNACLKYFGKQIN